MRDALAIISYLQTTHVLPGVPPAGLHPYTFRAASPSAPSPSAATSGLGAMGVDHKAFVRRTAELASGAQVVMELGSTPVVPGGDLNAFWRVK